MILPENTEGVPRYTGFKAELYIPTAPKVIEVSDVGALDARARDAGCVLVIPLEERWYRQNQSESGNRQFVIADPDGYLLRFFTDLGQRPLTRSGAPA